jgi:hypothetical protein
MSQAMHTRQVPIVQPLRVISALEDGVSMHAAPHSYNPDRTMVLH